MKNNPRYLVTKQQLSDLALLNKESSKVFLELIKENQEIYNIQKEGNILKECDIMRGMFPTK